MKQGRTINIIGVPISAITMKLSIEKLVYDLRKGARGGYICFANVHTTVLAHDDGFFRSVFSDSYMTLPDGKPLSVIGKARKQEMGRITGPDFMRKILEISEPNNYSHYFYGNTSDNMKKLIKCLKERYEGVQILGYRPSVFRPLETAEKLQLLDEIKSLDPDFIWIGLGAPRQEEFCYEFRNQFNGVMLGVGGAFNILNGSIPEAPEWIKNIGMEWGFRLLKEPRRLFWRYARNNSRFVYLLALEKIRDMIVRSKHQPGVKI